MEQDLEIEEWPNFEQNMLKGQHQIIDLVFDGLRDNMQELACHLTTYNTIDLFYISIQGCYTP